MTCYLLGSGVDLGMCRFGNHECGQPGPGRFSATTGFYGDVRFKGKNAMVERDSSQLVRFYAYLAIRGFLELTTWMLLLLPNYLKQQGWSSQEIGWAVGCFFLISMIFQTISGQIAERHGNVRTALIGTVLAGVGSLFYLGALWSSILIFPARVLHGAGAGMIFTGALIQLVESVPFHLRGRVMGYFGLPGFVMLGLGPLVSEWLVGVWGFEGIFLVVGSIHIATAWVLLRLPRPLRVRRDRRPAFREVLQISFPQLKVIIAFSFLVGFSVSVWHTFLAPVVVWMGVGAVSNYGLGYALGAILTRLGISHRLDMGSRRLAGISSLLVYSLGLALIPHVYFSWHLVVLGLVCGMSHGIYYPSLSSIAAERFHPLHTGQAMTLYTAASTLGLFIGAPVWGALADMTSYAFVFTVAALLLALSTVVFLLFVRPRAS